ncbi:carboxypeptidase B [Sergentomyia squamirostris]
MRNVLVLLVALFGYTMASQVSYEGYQVVTIKVDDPLKLQLLFQWQEQGIDFWDNMNSIGRPMRVMMPPNLVDDFPAFLREHEISYELTIRNVEPILEAERKVQMERRAWSLMNRASGRASNFTYYWQTPEINEYLRNLAAAHPNLVTLDLAGTSYQGREIYVLRISSTGFDGTKPKVFIDATIHAREWIAPMAALYLIEQMVLHPDQYPDLLSCDWIIIPVANPDGYQFSHDSNRMWRKTRSPNPGSTCIGTDGNRNYRYRWGFAGISTNPCSDVFLGSAPHSEVEVQAVSNELTKEAAGVKLYLSYHSFGDWLLFPWGYDRVYHDNHAQLQALGDTVADEIYRVHGRRYTVGNSAILLYPAAGASDDYAAAEHNIQLAYTVELTGGGSTGFDLPPDMILPVSIENLTGMRVYAQYIADNY